MSGLFNMSPFGMVAILDFWKHDQPQIHKFHCFRHTYSRCLFCFGTSCPLILQNSVSDGCLFAIQLLSGRGRTPTFQIPLTSHSHDLSWHKWDDRSRKVKMNAFNFRPTPWFFWPLTFQAVRKPCFSISFPRALGAKSQISRRWRRRRRHTNSQIQIQAPPNTPKDKKLPQGKPSLLI